MVRHGGDYLHEDHTFLPVYGEIILTVVREYPGLPDFRTMKLSELRYFYNGIRSELRERTKPKT